MCSSLLELGLLYDVPHGKQPDDLGLVYVPRVRSEVVPLVVRGGGELGLLAGGGGIVHKQRHLGRAIAIRYK